MIRCLSETLDLVRRKESSAATMEMISMGAVKRLKIYAATSAALGVHA